MPPTLISRLAPATDSPYRNLASAVLHQACKELNYEDLVLWLETRTGRFWIAVARLPHDLFVMKARDYYSGEEEAD